MAAIVPTAFRVVRVFDDGAVKSISNAHVAGRQGTVCYVATTGRAVAAQATTLATAGATSTKGAIIGLVSTDPRSNLAQEAVTVLRNAEVDLGAGVLDAMNVGAPVYLSAAVSGGLDDTAPATAANALVQIGYVVASPRESGTDKLLRIDTSWAARVGAVAVVPGG